MSERDERGGIITGFILRAAIMFSLLALAVFDAGAIIVAKVAVDGVATDAAREAALTYDRSGGSVKDARAECRTLARRAGAECVSLTIEDGVARARVRKEASTIIAHRIPPLEDLTVAEAEHVSPIP